MQKTFCNLCGKELTATDLAGGMMRSVEQYPLSPVKGLIDTPGMSNPTMVTKKIIQEVWDLCTDCSKYIWDAAAERQKLLKEKKLSPQGAPKSTLAKS